ncbi:hypothetical protein Q0Z83_025750 [Actinoplanes sichuanensis]|nr:hypothetical protein Q0Z83_025750 [Actinoplanes sichuanensis]
MTTESGNMLPRAVPPARIGERRSAVCGCGSPIVTSCFGWVHGQNLWVRYGTCRNAAPRTGDQRERQPGRPAGMPVVPLVLNDDGSRDNQKPIDRPRQRVRDHRLFPLPDGYVGDVPER